MTSVSAAPGLAKGSGLGVRVALLWFILRLRLPLVAVVFTAPVIVWRGVGGVMRER